MSKKISLKYIDFFIFDEETDIDKLNILNVL